MSRTETERDDYVAANRVAWDASAAWHHGNADWKAHSTGFATPGFSVLDPVLTGALEEIGVAGKAVAQIACNNGREILSVKNLGAGHCVGFDLSGAFLAQARELAAIGALDVEFVETDAYAIPARFDRSFDIVLITIGALGWMPDLPGFFAVVARLLRPGGRLVVYEQHAVVNMFDPAGATPLTPVNGYFRDTPDAADQAIIYDGTPAPDVGTSYWFFHTTADLITAVIGAGLRLDAFREYPHNISSVEFDIYETSGISLPLTYILLATREG